MPLPLTRLPPRAPSSSAIEHRETDACARFERHLLSSHFQPVLSMSMLRPVGHEALLRARDEADTPVSPLQLFGRLDPARQKELDCLTHLLHLGNFRHQRDRDHWLFLNMTPDVFLQARRAKVGHSFGDLLHGLQISPHSVVIEVLEEALRDSGEFESAVAYFCELGCLIALDDFGAGCSNFDRVWKIRPQIVKLDRGLILQAAQNRRVRRILPQLVSLLHEAGAMVLVEGIETTDEAYIALDANADFAQGYLFGHPQPTIAAEDGPLAALNELWNEFDQRSGQEWTRQKQSLAPYTNAIGNASVLLSAGRSMTEACASFLELSGSSICFLLDEKGRQIGCNLVGDQYRSYVDPRLAPLGDTHDARWSRCPYFRRALEGFGRVQVTRPYLSIATASMCVTVSVSFMHEGRTRVICGDVRWPLAAGD